MAECKRNAIEMLNRLIEMGNPPDSVSSEFHCDGRVRIRFGWNDDTCLYMIYSDLMYRMVLERFLDFWGTSLPKTIPVYLKDIKKNG
jgi:hypothetical protein